MSRPWRALRTWARMVKFAHTVFALPFALAGATLAAAGHGITFEQVGWIVIAMFGKSPVWLVLIASALAYFVAPVIFFLNFYYCITVIPKSDKSFYPSTFARWFTWLSLVVFTGMIAILIQSRIVDRIFGE